MLIRLIAGTAAFIARPHAAMSDLAILVVPLSDETQPLTLMTKDTLRRRAREPSIGSITNFGTYTNSPTASFH